MMKSMKSMRLKSVYVVMLLALLLSVLPVAGGGVALAGAGDLVPTGDALGDVGQYYSQISPNLNTNAYIHNTSSTSEDVEIKIYDDTGTVVRTVTCAVAANRVLKAQFDASQGELLYLVGGTGTGCTGNGVKFHGLYHMKITQTSAGSDLAVAVNNWTSTDSRGVSGAYQAVPEWATSGTYVLPVVFVYRDYGWDTEIVVQNTTGNSNTVVFWWVMDGESTKYSNNTATIPPYGRRVFLASQLLYAGSGGNLTEKDGWAWMKVVGSASGLAVTTNSFKQGLTNGKYRAELGSERMMSFEAPVAGTDLFIPGFVVNGTYSYFRIANASDYTASITAKLYNSSGSQVGSTYSPSLAAERAGVYASSVFGASNGTYTLRIQSNNNVTAAGWHETTGGHTGVTAQRSADSGGYSVYSPFLWENSGGWNESVYLTFTGGGGSGTSTGCYMSNGSCGEPAGITVDQYDSYPNGWSGWNAELYIKNSSNSAYNPLQTVKQEYSSTTNDWLMSYNSIAKTDDIWYVPFAPAPVVQFGWDTTEDANYPSVRFGWSGSPENRAGTVPAWAKDLNWFDWSQTRASCSSYSRYIPLAPGFKDVGGSYNSYPRLSAIQNRTPSACAGRPMLLANEPNATDQWDMTHHEVARQVFMYRAWPGDLHSQAYAKEFFVGGSSGYDIGTTYTSASETQGKTDPERTDYSSFKSYWSNNMSSTFGSLPYDSLAVHFYLFKGSNGVEPTTGMVTARQNEIAEWKTEAQNMGYKVQVTEYGILPVADPNHFLYCNATCISDRVSKLHDGILNNLSSTYRQLMWYSFADVDCRAPNYCNLPDPLDWRWTIAMESVSGTWQPTNPVGQTWVNDTKGR